MEIVIMASLLKQTQIQSVTVNLPFHSPTTSDTYCSTELWTIHIEIKLPIKQIVFKLLTVHIVVEFPTVYAEVKFPIKQILLKILTVHIAVEFPTTYTEVNFPTIQIVVKLRTIHLLLNSQYYPLISILQQYRLGSNFQQNISLLLYIFNEHTMYKLVPLTTLQGSYHLHNMTAYSFKIDKNVILWAVVHTYSTFTGPEDVMKTS